MHVVPNAAEEVFYSPYFRKELQPVQIVKVMNKHYLWYEASKIDEKEVIRKKNTIFDRRVHKFYDFLSEKIISDHYSSMSRKKWQEADNRLRPIKVKHSPYE